MAERMMRADEFPNILTKEVTMSGANTLTFSELEVGLNIFDKAAMIIQRIEYYISPAMMEEMTASGDDIITALSTSNTLSSLDPEQTDVVDSIRLHRFDMGTPGTGIIQNLFIEHDFSTMKGGGIIIAPKPLYFAVGSQGLASAGSVTFRVYFVLLRLQDSQYLELLQTRNQFG